jgi:FkbM family methyltransferase
MNSIQTAQCKHGKFSYFTNDTIIGKSLDMYGEYCEQEFTIMEHIVRPTDFIIDVGANIGVHTIWLSKHAFQGRVSSFEPNEFSRELLLKNLYLNNSTNVTVYNNVVGNGMSSVFISSYSPHIPGNYGECSVLDKRPGNYHSAQMLTIDQLDPVKVDFMKIDVEGYEMEVIKGARSTIEKFRPSMLIEVNDSLPHIDFLYKELVPKDYQLYWLPVRNYNPNNYKGNKTNIFMNSGVVNIIAAHKDKTHIKTLDTLLAPVTSADDSYIKMHKRRTF